MIQKAGGDIQKVYQVSSIVGLSKRPPVPVVTENANLADVCEALASGHHRVLVVNKAGNLTHLVTQSAVAVRFFAVYIRELRVNSKFRFLFFCFVFRLF
jgi:CBS-domain-containing membrane protein